MRVPEDTAPWSSLQDAPGTRTSYVPQPADPASILYTSGTTGPPKGAIIPHEKCLTTPREITLRSRLSEDSVLFTALPLFHCNAQEMTMLTALLHDLRGEFTDRFHASTFWESTRSVEATHISLLIAMINVLFKQPEGPADREHSVRTALTAGTTRAVWPEFEHRFGVTIIELYGMTECGCTTLMNPPDAIQVGSVGTPLGFVEAEVVDDDDRPSRTASAASSSSRPRQPFTMFLGYHAKPEKTVEAWRNLWFHTGDFVTRNADGYYYFVDRKKDVIRRRGENVAPYERGDRAESPRCGLRERRRGGPLAARRGGCEGLRPAKARGRGLRRGALPLLHRRASFLHGPSPLHRVRGGIPRPPTRRPSDSDFATGQGGSFTTEKRSASRRVLPNRVLHRSVRLVGCFSIRTGSSFRFTNGVPLESEVLRHVEHARIGVPSSVLGELARLVREGVPESSVALRFAARFRSFPVRAVATQGFSKQPATWGRSSSPRTVSSRFAYAPSASVFSDRVTVNDSSSCWDESAVPFPSTVGGNG